MRRWRGSPGHGAGCRRAETGAVARPGVPARNTGERQGQEIKTQVEGLKEQGECWGNEQTSTAMGLTINVLLIRVFQLRDRVGDQIIGLRGLLIL